jgi:2-phosphoglycerate kinase
VTRKETSNREKGVIEATQVGRSRQELDRMEGEERVDRYAFWRVQKKCCQIM